MLPELNRSAASSRRVRVYGGEERLSRAQTFETFDRATRTFVHRTACGNHLEVVCPDCREKRRIPRGRLTILKHTIGKDRVTYAQCKSCSATRNASKGRQSRQMWILSQRLVRLESHPPETPGDETLKRYLLAHGLTTANAEQFVKLSDPDFVPIRRLLDGEDRLRTTGGGNVERGRAILAKTARAQVPGIGQLPQALAAHSRAIVSLGALHQTFALCPLCGLVVARRGAAARERERIWHGPCSHAWREGQRYRTELLELATAVWRGVDVRILPRLSMPTPPIGQRVSRDSLALGYQILAAQMRGVGYETFAKSIGKSKQAVQQPLLRLEAGCLSPGSLCSVQKPKGWPRVKSSIHYRVARQTQSLHAGPQRHEWTALAFLPTSSRRLPPLT